MRSLSIVQPRELSRVKKVKVIFAHLLSRFLFMYLYIAHLAQFKPSYLIMAKEWLTNREQRKISHYHQAKDKKTALVSCIMRREILAGYLDCHPSDLSFTVGACGKPLLEGNSSLHFNVSHSGDYVVIAIDDSIVGVDVELQDSTVDFLGVGSLVFAQGEMEQLKNCSSKEEQCSLFYDQWTQKEAYLKAIGEGFQCENPSSFDFSSECLRRVKICGQDYRMSSIHYLRGYSLSLCYKEDSTCMIKKFTGSI